VSCVTGQWGSASVKERMSASGGSRCASSGKAAKLWAIAARKTSIWRARTWGEIISRTRISG